MQLKVIGVTPTDTRHASVSSAVTGPRLEHVSWAHIFTTHEFWTGGVIVGGLGSIGTYFTTHASDKRKFKQEDKVLDRRETREDKLREEENLYAAASEFTEVCTDILTNTIDTKRAFNAIRDMFYNRAGRADPNVENKRRPPARATWL